MRCNETKIDVFGEMKHDLVGWLMVKEF